MDPSFQGWNWKALWIDAKVGMEISPYVKRVAIVGAPEWVKQGAELFAKFGEVDARCFGPHEFESALSWVEEPLPPKSELSEADPVAET
jgi:hypothetical protein